MIKPSKYIQEKLKIPVRTIPNRWKMTNIPPNIMVAIASFLFPSEVFIGLIMKYIYKNIIIIKTKKSKSRELILPNKKLKRLISGNIGRRIHIITNPIKIEIINTDLNLSFISITFS